MTTKKLTENFVIRVTNPCCPVTGDSCANAPEHGGCCAYHGQKELLETQWNKQQVESQN